MSEGEEAAHKNGLGRGIVNTNSKDFKALKYQIEADAATQDKAERIEHVLFSLHLRMRTYVETTLPEEQMRIGAFVKLHLSAVGVKNKVFAQYVQMEASNFSAVLSGRRKLNSDLALKLEKLFNVPALLWLQVQNKNELIALQAATPEKYKKYTLKRLLKKKV
jgi:plasmid maintenance system antidote protein VapI